MSTNMQRARPTTATARDQKTPHEKSCQEKSVDAHVSETALVSSLLRILEPWGAWAHRVNTGQGRRRGGGGWIEYGLGRGGPDILALYRGIAMAIEAKVGSNDLSDAQLAWRAEWTRHGGRYHRVSSTSEMLKILTDIDNGGGP